MKKILVILITMIMFIPALSFGVETLPGDYEIIGDINKAFGKDHVTMIEFFNFSCRHCYNFLATSKTLQKKYGKKLVHKKIPIFWGKQTLFPAIAFYLARKKGMDEEVTQALFDANFLGGAKIFDPRVVNFIISETGITEDVRNLNDLHSEVKEGMDLAARYEARETPTIILNGVVKVTPRIAKGDINKMTENLDLIISKLLSK